MSPLFYFYSMRNYWLFILFFSLTGMLTSAQEVQWLTVEDAFAKSKANPKPILVDVYTDWCGWCKRMDKTTYKNEVIVEYINKHFYPVKFNAEQKDSVNLGGQVFRFTPQGRRGYHELAVALLNGKLSYPTTVFLDQGFNMIQPVGGYLDEKGLEPILVFMAEGYYKSEPWEDFQAKFKSKIK